MSKYPGLGLPLRERLDDGSKDEFYPMGAHAECSGSESVPLPVRELAMMSVMNTLTDKKDWHKKVFDEKIVAKWREEAIAIPDDYFWDLAEAEEREHSHPTETPARMLNDKSFEYCIQELQAKARYFEKARLIPTLDAHATVVKSDSLVSPELHQALLQAFKKLLKDHEASPDWHPNTNGMVHDLVHPSMYPLVYGRSKVFNEEIVGVHDAITKWAGKGDLILKETGMLVNPYSVPAHYWSETYQWLPSNVAFQEDGSVRFTSYVNNLHPIAYPDVYRTIERLIETCLPMWDQCLVRQKDHETAEGTGRTRSRFTVEDRSDENPKHWVPECFEDCAALEVTEDQLEDEGYDPELFDDEYFAEFKWRILRKPVLSDPDDYEPMDYTPKQGQRLIELFRDSGLQVIVKIASIELTPDKPDFPVGGWHVEGQLNEHICGTALYYLDSENITSSNLSFRMQTDSYLSDDSQWQVGQDCYKWMNTNYGTDFGVTNGVCLQNYGSVETPEGRLLCFPNVFQHRVSPFRLIDPTKPGHRRFIALWLVDPHMRIISTANVPPQQMSWWAGSVLGRTPEARKEALSKLPPDLVVCLQEQGITADGPPEDPKLPRELMEMVRGYIDADKDALPMSAEEANAHREKLMEERSAFHKDAEGSWQSLSYSFCEH